MAILNNVSSLEEGLILFSVMLVDAFKIICILFLFQMYAKSLAFNLRQKHKMAK